ncbi:SDR family NAD(P)-dependent oxidoreductase [Rhodococcus koreensis]|uniref:SDR family NAD(P)-dependent oxidoreductase n=1 Tax=Rhodococcus koreensis TaxID=99653 RepID=UPI00366E8A50
MTANTTQRDLPRTAAGTAPGHNTLAGKKILVIGGGQRVVDSATDPTGNGRAMSVLAAREGADVLVADRDLRSAQDTVEIIEHADGAAHAVRADVSDPGYADNLVHGAIETLGGLDGMVYNVGIGIEALDLAGVEVDDWDRTFAVNVRGAALAIKAAVPLMNPGGSIVLISSTAALRSGGRLVAYQASKAALTGLMRHSALEASDRGIRVNIVCPGMVDTPNGRATTAANPNRLDRVATIPLGRMATAWDIAYAVSFFLSDQSSFVTSQVLAVDGGTTGT